MPATGRTTAFDPVPRTRRAARRGATAAWLRALLGDRTGATAIEYGLIAGGISVAIIVVVFAIGAEVNGFLERIGDMLRAHAPGS
jgi:pilus assembly protein Flp/PilA